MKSLHRVLGFFVFIIGACVPAHAACWRDDGVGALAWQTAQQRFAVVTQRMPDLLVCSQDEFQPNVAGDYNAGLHRIRVGNWLDRQTLAMVVAHEVAHAEVALTGGDGGRDGHGPGWVAVMTRAGLFHEAQRMAQFSPDAALAVSQQGGQQQGQGWAAGPGGWSRPPCGCQGGTGLSAVAPPPVRRTCQIVLVPVQVPGGVQFEPRQFCSAGS